MRSNEWKWLTESKKLRYDDIFRRTISLCQVLFSLKFFFLLLLAFMYESSVLFFLQLAKKSNCLKPGGEGKCLQFTKLKTLKIQFALLICEPYSLLMLQYYTNSVTFVFFSKETLLLEPEKSAPRIETLEPEKVDEEEEGKKDESSCSSEEEEEEDSESETEAGTV